MAKEDNAAKKVYSPDISTYSFEGNTYFFGTMLSFLVAPIRLISRTMHNIFVLPADLVQGYANSLLIVSLILLAIGGIDYYMYGKWCLGTTQLFMVVYAIWLKRKATRSIEFADSKRQVEIDEEAIEEECNKLLDEINNVLGSE